MSKTKNEPIILSVDKVIESTVYRGQTGIYRIVVVVKNSFISKVGDIVKYNGCTSIVTCVERNYQKPVFNIDENGEENKDIMIRKGKYEDTLTLTVVNHEK